MQYIPLHPTSRDDLAGSFTTLLTTLFRYLFSLVASPPGSGKSRLMRVTTEHWYAHHGAAMVYIFSPNSTLDEQLRTVFADNTLGAPFELICGARHDAKHRICLARSKGVLPVVFFTNMGFHSTCFTEATKSFLRLLYAFKDDKQLVLIDEIDRQLTHLTGGMNASFYHASGHLHMYDTIRRQAASLNLFDKLRRFKATVIGFSGTLNNVICSKLVSTGYTLRDTFIVNAYPITSLYEHLNCISVDTSSFDALDPHLRKAESEDGHILMVFSDKKKLLRFIDNYTESRGHPPEYTRIDSDSSAPSVGSLKKYILGIDMLSIGFDLSTWMPGCRFVLGVLVRELADKGSQPLSSNPASLLYHEVSALLMQTLLRMRHGGTFLTPEKVGEVDIVAAVRRVSEIIEDGYTQFALYGSIMKHDMSQLQRWNLSSLIAICQNLCDVNRPTVAKCLAILSDITGGRDLATEAGPTLDIAFWTDAVGVMWELFWAESKYCSEDAEEFKATCVAGFRERTRTLSLRGGGARTPRLTDDEVRAIVIERAHGRCMECGGRVRDTQMVVAHIHLDSEGGLFTEENLCVAHRDCDASFDEANILLSPDKTTLYSVPRYASHTPDVTQLAYISTDNLTRRWEWAKKKLGMPGVDDATFVAWLHAEEYVAKSL